MILLEDVIGKSNKPIIEKRTVLTEKHIEFLRKFMINQVMVTPLPKNLHTEKEIRSRHRDSNFQFEFEQIVKGYQKTFNNIKNNVPINNLFEIRKQFIPFFETVQEMDIAEFIYLVNKRSKDDILYYKSVAMSVLAVYLAKHMDYEKKDWLQIGFAALLADSGFAKLPQELQNEKDQERPSETFRLHPVYSYKVVEKITTLTKAAKIAIIQHHERLDGSGYPAKIDAEKITPYARILGVCDYYYQTNVNEMLDTIHLLESKKGVKLDKRVVNLLIEKLNTI